MAFVETLKTTLTIKDDGQIEYRKTRVITDGTDTFEKNFRQVLEPGQDVTTFPPRVRAICNLLWTAQVIADYQAAKAARGVI